MKDVESELHWGQCVSARRPENRGIHYYALAFLNCLGMTHQFDLPARHQGSNTKRPLCVCLSVCVCVRAHVCPALTEFGASPRTQSLKSSGKSLPPHSWAHTIKLKTKQQFACTHTLSPSAWLICRQFVLSVFCVEVADSAGGHLTISPTYCCQSLHNNTWKVTYI